MHTHSIILALAQAAVTLAVCPDGWVGVGTGQLCNPNTVGGTGAGGDCGSQDGRIYANDCGIIATTTSVFVEGFCGATWDSGASVDCDSSGTMPTLVHTSGGDFGNCQNAQDSGSTVCTPPSFPGPYGIFAVDYCCEKL